VVCVYVYVYVLVKMPTSLYPDICYRGGGREGVACTPLSMTKMYAWTQEARCRPTSRLQNTTSKILGCDAD
jgi:hypothetical protein